MNVIVSHVGIGSTSPNDAKVIETAVAASDKAIYLLAFFAPLGVFEYSRSITGFISPATRSTGTAVAMSEK